MSTTPLSTLFHFFFLSNHQSTKCNECICLIEGFWFLLFSTLPARSGVVNLLRSFSSFLSLPLYLNAKRNAKLLPCFSSYSLLAISPSSHPHPHPHSYPNPHLSFLSILPSSFSLLFQSLLCHLFSSLRLVHFIFVLHASPPPSLHSIHGCIRISAKLLPPPPPSSTKHPCSSTTSN